jgi:hypothetical protein
LRPEICKKLPLNPALVNLTGVVDMLINNDAVNLNMSLAEALNSGFECSPKQIEQAVAQLKSGESEKVPWDEFVLDKYDSIMKHQEYSGAVIDGLDCSESNEVLMLILGEDGNHVFDKVLNSPSNNRRTVEQELSSLIGSEIISEYSKSHQSFGFEKYSINVRVKYITDPEHLVDIDLDGYMALVILESHETLFETQVIDWLKLSEHSIPIIYNFSFNISQSIAKLSEEEAADIAASWVFTLHQLNPSIQVDYLLHCLNLLLVEFNYDNTNSHSKDIMYEQYLHQKRNKTSSEALIASCKLTSSGHNYFRTFVDKAITLHKRAIEKVQNMILPDVFNREHNPRTARDIWVEEIISKLCSKFDLEDLQIPVMYLIGMHKNFDDASQWRGDLAKESIEEKLQRWAGGLKSQKEEDLKQTFLIQDNGRKFYGSTKNKPHGYIEKIDFTGQEIWDKFDAEKSLATNLNPRFWPFFRKLYAITNAFKYDVKTKDPPLTPELKSRINVSEVSKIRKVALSNLLNELFIGFANDGGVIQ